MARLFGTDGVRGVANRELTSELAMALGRAGACVLAKGAHKPRILVGMDTRISCDMLEAALSAGICSVGAQSYSAGVLPTPAIAYLTRYYGMDAGVVISASHNPAAYNGIKFFNAEGYKLPDEVEDEIEKLIRDPLLLPELPDGDGVGHRVVLDGAIDQYIAFLKHTLPENFSLQGIKIVADCANGASYAVAPRVLRELGADVIAIHCEPDGLNINCGCGSTHMEALQRRVTEEKADLGLAFDGDADRMLAVDECGKIVDGDQVMLICALDARERGALPDNTLVVTVMSNLGLMIAAREKGLHTEITAVGDRYVLERMREKQYVLGGEQSGHIIFLEHNTTGDGLVSALQLLRIVASSGRTLSERAGVMTVMPQVLINAPVDNAKKHEYEKDEEIQRRIREIEARYDGAGRVLIRPSGTEALVRVMIEGADKADIEKDARALAEYIEQRMA